MAWATSDACSSMASYTRTSVGLTRLVLLFGGRSAEHDVSCVTAAHVLAAADPERYEVVPVGITHEGRWVRAEAAADRLTAEGPEVQPGEVLLSGAGVVETVAFPVLHGPFGEDGTAQGLLEMLGVPYVGTGVLGSALCMDKAMAKDAAAAHGLPQVRHLAFRDVDLDDDFDGAMARTVADLGLPVFVKPANLGSSVGVTRAADVGELGAAVKLALDFDEWVVVEEAVTAREIECGVLGYGRLRASVPGEIRPSHDFYDYDDKYADGARRAAGAGAAPTGGHRRGPPPGGGRRHRPPGRRHGSGRLLLRGGRPGTAAQRGEHHPRLHADLHVSQDVGGHGSRLPPADRRPGRRRPGPPPQPGPALRPQPVAVRR